jgi:hypothetical protein
VLGLTRSLPTCDEPRCHVLFRAERHRRLRPLDACAWSGALAALAAVAERRGTDDWYILPCDGQGIVSSVYGRRKLADPKERLGRALVALVPGACAEDSELVRRRTYVAAASPTSGGEAELARRARRRTIDLRICEHGTGELRVAALQVGGKVLDGRATPWVEAHTRLFMTFGAEGQSEYEYGPRRVLRCYVEHTAEQRDLWAAFCAPGLKTFRQRFAVRALLQESGVWDAPPQQQQVIAAIGPHKERGVPLDLAYLQELLTVTEVAAAR